MADSQLDTGSFIGDILNFVPNLVFGSLDYVNQKNYNKQQIENTRLNRQMQYDFAQNGISWKVNDAKSAGIHPLYALGANTNTFTPTHLDTQPLSYSGVSKAVNSLTNELLKAQIDGQKLDNAKKAQDLNGGISSQVVAPAVGVSPATIQGQGITDAEQTAEMMRNRREDGFTMPIYDKMIDEMSNKVPDGQEYDWLLSLSSGVAHYVPKGETYFQQRQSLGDVIDRVGAWFNSKYKYLDSYGQVKGKDLKKLDKILKSIDKMHE